MDHTATDQQVIQGVTDTLLDYCQLLDAKRLDEFAALFTEDCVFEEGPPAVGRAHVRARVRKMLLLFDALSHHLCDGDRWRIARRVVQVQGWKGLDELPMTRVPQAKLPD